jgi:hypothetical protein
MDKVWISHPQIDGGARKVPVSASALWQYQRAGWDLTDPPPPRPPRRLAGKATKTSEAPTVAGTSALPETPPRGRRSTTKGDE